MALLGGRELVTPLRDRREPMALLGVKIGILLTGGGETTFSFT